MCYGYDGEGALRRSLEEHGMSRRSLLRGALATAAGAAAYATAGPGVAAQATAPSVRPVPPGRISIQLWTVREALRGSPGFDATLASIAGMGYPRVEQALGYFGRSAGELRSFYDSIGIWASSSHDGISGSPAGLTRKLENAATLGQRFVVVPFLRSNSLSDWQRWAEQMNVEAAAARGYDLAYGYHNHAHEFTIDLGGGLTPWEVLTSELDPSVVHLEIDLYWVVRGGIESGQGVADPEQFAIDTMAAAPQRVRQYHVKDRHEADGDMADLGTGMIDFPRIFAAHQVEEYIVENDTPDVTPLQTADVGYSYLRNVRI